MNDVFHKKVCTVCIKEAFSLNWYHTAEKKDFIALFVAKASVFSLCQNVQLCSLSCVPAFDWSKEEAKPMSSFSLLCEIFYFIFICIQLNYEFIEQIVKPSSWAQKSSRKQNLTFLCWTQLIVTRIHTQIYSLGWRDLAFLWHSRNWTHCCHMSIRYIFRSLFPKNLASLSSAKFSFWKNHRHLIFYFKEQSPKRKF